MDIGKVFSYQFEDRQWITKLGLGALISLVPILNVAITGYMVGIIRNVAAHERLYEQEIICSSAARSPALGGPHPLPPLPLGEGEIESGNEYRWVRTPIDIHFLEDWQIDRLWQRGRGAGCPHPCPSLQDASRSPKGEGRKAETKNGYAGLMRPAYPFFVRSQLGTLDGAELDSTPPEATRRGKG